VHNLRRPLDRLTLTLTLTFDLVFIGGRGIMNHDGPSLCQVCDLSLSHFGFIVRTDRQTESEADEHDYRHTTHMTTVSMSN